jgi:phenylacetate-CoA ligase
MKPYAFAVRHIIWPAWDRKNGNLIGRHHAEMVRRQFWSPEQLAQHQWVSFKRIVTHAVETCPFYRESFRRAGVSPADLRVPADIRWVPTVTKEEIQQHREEMISSQYAQARLFDDMTGGSTGSPMRFAYDWDRYGTRAAATLRHDEWSGWRIGERRAMLWGASQDMKRPPNWKVWLREKMINRRMILDASALDDAAMMEFVRKLRRYRPTMLLAYANTMGLFSRWVEAQKITDLRPGSIITSAEVLTPENRVQIERTFGCRIFNRYGCREFAVIASECSAHEGMHVNADNLLLETLSGEEPVRGEDGEIVITDLRNFAMPMIRYRIRDVGVLKEKQCSCGRGLPLMELSGGRVTDFLTATSGRKVSGIVLATYVITRLPGVAQVQFVQTHRGSVTVNLVKGPQWSDETTQATLLAKAREFLGPDMHFEVSFQDRIQQEKSGKYRFAVSHL